MPVLGRVVSLHLLFVYLKGISRGKHIFGGKSLAIYLVKPEADSTPKETLRYG